MSIEVELTLQDYKTILNWFELAFAKNKTQNKGDMNTFKKLSVMMLTKAEEIKDENRLSD